MSDVLSLSKCEWKEYKLKDAPIEIIDGDRGKNYPSQDQFFQSGHCLFLSTKNVRQTGFDFSDSQFITVEKDNLLRKGKLTRFDTILTTRGTVGNVAFYGNDVPYNNIRINSGMVIIRPRREQIDPKYCFYLFRSLQKSFETFTSGSAQPQLPIRDLNEMEILLPPLPEQKTIAAILSSLDDKIDLLHRQNKTLEALAETLFRQWFVEDAAEGWEENIGDLPIEIIDGDRGRNYPKNYELSDNGYCLFLNTKNITENGFNFSVCQFISEEKDKILRGGKLKRQDIILTTRGTVGNIAFYDDKIRCHHIRINSGMVIFRTDVQYLPSIYLYTLMKTKYFKELIENHTSGSAQPQLPIRDIKYMKIIYPPKVALKQFTLKIEPIFEKVFLNNAQIRTLTRLRDTLLPKLISGEIRKTSEMQEAIINAK